MNNRWKEIGRWLIYVSMKPLCWVGLLPTDTRAVSPTEKPLEPHSPAVTQMSSVSIADKRRTPPPAPSPTKAVQALPAAQADSGVLDKRFWRTAFTTKNIGWKLLYLFLAGIFLSQLRAPLDTIIATGLLLMIVLILESQSFQASFSHQKKRQLIGRQISALHGALVGVMAILYSFGQLSEESWQQSLALVRAYCMLDIWLMAFYSEDIIPNKLYCLHHLCLMLTVTVPYEQAQWLLPIGLASEITQPFLQYGWYLIQLQKQDSLSFQVNSLLVVISFLVFRCANFSWILYTLMRRAYMVGKQLLEHKKVSLDEALPGLCFTPIWLMNLYWGYKLAAKVVSVVKKTEKVEYEDQT